MKTNEELINELLDVEEQKQLKEEVNSFVLEYKGRGGKRENSGRKSITGKVLKFTKRLTQEEVDFINYARLHNIDYVDLMQE